MAPIKKTPAAPDGAADAPAAADLAFAPDAPLEPDGDASTPATDDGPADEPEAVAEVPASDWPVMSAGVASDLAMQGWAGDPGTGGMWRRDAETGEVTYTPRSGEAVVIGAQHLPGVLTA